MPATQSSIKRRLRAIMLLTSGLVLLASFTAFIIYEIISFRTQLVQHLGTLAAVIADNSAYPLIFGNKPNAEEILSALKAEPDIIAAVLYDSQDQPFASFPPNLATNQFPPHPEPAGHRFYLNSVVLFRPILHENKPLGSLYFHCSLGALYTRLSRYAAMASLILAVCVMAAAVLSTVLQRRVSEPILALTNAAQKVAGTEDYSIRAPRLSDDEIGVLAEEFNRMLAQIQEHQSRLAEQAQLLNLSFDAIIVLDARRHIIYWNRGATEIYGYSAEEAAGASIDEILQTEFPGGRAQVLESFYKDGRWFGELLHTRKDGVKITVISRWSLDRDAQGRPLRTLETNNDITERKRTEQDLAQARAKLQEHANALEVTVAERTARLRETIGELEAFSYSISHDMRAPLRAIAAYAKALLEDASAQLSADARDYVANIVSASVRLDRLITDVLAYSRVTREQRRLEPVNVERLIDEVVSHFPELQTPRAKIQIARPLPMVIGDEASLGQCISNLLTNAVKFVAPGVVPAVRIRAEPVAGTPGDSASVSDTDPKQPIQEAQRDKFVRLWFEDNGIGIAEKDRGRIFGIFERVHPREKFEGTGIGLAIVKKAVERMGGRVGVESEPGKGSRFWLELRTPTASR